MCVIRGALNVTRYFVFLGMSLALMGETVDTQLMKFIVFRYSVSCSDSALMVRVTLYGIHLFTNATRMYIVQRH